MSDPAVNKDGRLSLDRPDNLWEDLCCCRYIRQRTPSMVRHDNTVRPCFDGLKCSFRRHDSLDNKRLGCAAFQLSEIFHRFGTRLISFMFPMAETGTVYNY